ncbi:MAG: SUMF1/EgtB/PvdO family nonheme iron enzyme [Anaerolineae bacterium]|nr:SUMF1/EgtB/PvdO family nonheme iron enzyme [Anaerolineae bacterium]
MPSRKSSPKKKTSTAKHKSAPARVTRNVIGGHSHVACADFVGGDKRTINYGFTPRDVERLIVKVLAFLERGAAFLPDERQREVLRAQVDGETLTFHAGAALKLWGRRDERSYLLSLTVRREYQMWATKFIPLAARVDAKRDIQALDMPVQFSEFRVPRGGSDALAQVTFEPLPDITEALDRHSAFVILGEPGAGKTTTLQKIAFEAARRLLATGDGRVPLFVRLSEQSNREPFEFLRDEWERHTGSDFADALAAGRVLVLADGINELPREGRLKAWRLFALDQAEANRIVFTGRERDYDRQLYLPRVRVEPLDEARIADYLERNDAGGLAALLDDPNTRLREMAGNPFNLALLVAAYRDNQRDMANRGRLMEWFVDELFKREEKLEHRDWLHRDVQTRALAQLAYAMQEQGEGTTLWLRTAPALLPQSVEHAGQDVPVKPADLFRCARAATLLDPATDPKDIRFYHHLLQEYFAALDLLRRYDKGEDLSGLWRAKRLADEMPPADVGEWDALPEPPATGWEVTTILACGLAKDPARLIETIRPLNSVLAGRCLDESGIDKPIAVTNSVRADLLSDLNNPAIHLRARLQAGYTLGRIDDPRFVPQLFNGVKVIVPVMAPVPPGEYHIGSADDDQNADDDEKPQHTVSIPAFEIGRYPVTNAEFACFIKADGYKQDKYWETDLAKRWLQGEDVTGGQFGAWLDEWRWMQDTFDWKERHERSGNYSPDEIKTLEYIASLSEDELRRVVTSQLGQKSREHPHYWDDAQYNNASQPVVGITWFEARAYCAWLTEMTGKWYRLPTEAEWEAAARGKQAHIYAWGDDWDATKANTIEGRVLKPSPVGVYDAVAPSPFGTSDQTGNVWDWTSTLHQPYPYAIDDREDENAGGERVVRGGSFPDFRIYARCANRGRDAPVNFYYNLCFRVLSPGS